MSATLSATWLVGPLTARSWWEHGAAAIQTVRETRPDVYVKVVASLLPRQIQAEVSGPAHPLATAIDGGDIVDPVLGRYGVSALIKQKPKAVVDGLIVAIGVDDVINESGVIAAGYPDEIPLKPLE